MPNLFQNNSEADSEHPPREMLLLFVDGELRAKEAAHLEAHLEACWTCRVKTQKIQNSIAAIMEFDDKVLTKGLVPPQGWRNFDRRLRQLAASSGKQSLSSRFFGSLGRYLPLSHTSEIAQSLLRPAFLRGAVAIALVVVIVAVAIRFSAEPTVSASQILNNAIEAQARQTGSVFDAVSHEKLRISRKDGSTEQSVDLEIWHDAKNSRVRQFLTVQSVQVALGSSNTSAPVTAAHSVADELISVLQNNHMDPVHPLSAASYKSWHNTLQGQRDEVTRIKLDNDIAALSLHTFPSFVKPGQIAEASFVVRADDWLPAELRIAVASETGMKVYNLTQTQSEIVSLAEVNPAIFANQPLSVALATASPRRELAKKETPEHASNLQPLNTAPAATVDLEVEALRLLNQAGADLGEQVSVKRTSAGLLEITGIVETDQRKKQINDALMPIAGNPSVRIDIQTVTEAVAKQGSNKPTPLPTTRAVEITSNVMAAEPELRAYFAGKGNTDEAVRRYAARMVGLSGRAMDHLWAMKRLLNQFSSEEARFLTADARSKWIALIRLHARSYQQITASLRRELHPVFFPTQSVRTAAEGSPVTDLSELIQLVNQLFESGSSNDRVIRSAFTSSSGGVMTTIIKTPHFWQSLKNTETLAVRVSRAQ